eukprot:TRINITY_DN1036_c0_g2_i1.p2 TRINITY_DN1036_c0_g2~~TRINITY_DN1036_c0_g2_i1.p2  ORF type:complete len:109 (+),score=28.81 TRINITY_DN1036_c0_g2_i1:606-932(+)
MDVIALVDCSASMKKIFPIVKACLKHLIGRLTINGKMGIVGFGTQSATILELQPVAKKSKQAIYSAIERMATGTGTNLGRGVSHAVRMMNSQQSTDRRIRYILLFTEW